METELAQTPEITFDLDRLVTSRGLIQANSGGGKSRMLRYLLEKTSGKVQQIVFDPEGEFASLREKFPFLLAGIDGEVPTRPETARLLCRRTMELGVSVIIDLYDLPLSQRREYVRLFVDELMRLPREFWRPLLVVVDEAHVFCPERGAGDSVSTEALIALCSQGRKRGFCPIFATQRIAKLHKDAASELLNNLIGRTSLDNDMARAGDSLGMDKAGRQALKRLMPGQFYAVGPALGENGVVHLVRTGDVQTTHPEPGKVAPLPPPTPEAIKALAAAFEGLEQEAQTEAETIETLKRQLKEAQAGGQKNLFPTVQERIVERIKEVPVLNPDQEEQIRLLIETATVISEALLQKATAMTAMVADMQATGDDLKNLTQNLQTSLDGAQRPSAQPPTTPVPELRDVPEPLALPAPAPEPAQTPEEPTETATAPTDEYRGLNVAARRILRVLALHRGMKIDLKTLALLADFSPTGGNGKASLRVLIQNKWIWFDKKEATYAATDAGQAVAGVGPVGRAEEATAALMALWETIFMDERTGNRDAFALLRILVAQRFHSFLNKAEQGGINKPLLAGRAGFKIGMRLDSALLVLEKHDLVYRAGSAYVASDFLFPLMA